MKKQTAKLLSLFLTLTLLLASLPTVGFATAGTLTGSGTADDPYQIEDAADLHAFRDLVNNGARTLCAKLTQDIDLQGAAWTPIGGDDGYATSFYGGTFDGDGHTVSDFSINASYNFAGFFSYVKDNACIENLRLADAQISSNKNNVGGIAGTIIAGKIENCSFAGSVTNTKASGGYAGGIAGYIGNTKNTTPTVRNCVNTASISGPYAGGIAGYAKFASPIENCYNTGAIAGGTRTGGIVGQSMNGTAIENCYNIGTLTGSGIGGIAGFNGVSMTNCYWTNPEDGFGGGTGTAQTCAQITSPDGLLAKLGNAFAADEKTINGGYPILAWQTGAAQTPKNPHLQIEGNMTLAMTNTGAPVQTTLQVQAIDMDEVPTVSWSIQSGSDCITIEAPTNADAQNSTVIVRASKPGMAVVVAETADGVYSADCEISVLPFITTVEIDGTVAAGETVYAKVNILGGDEYDYETYPALRYQWKYLTGEDYETGNTGSSAYKPLVGETARAYTLPQDFAGNYLSFTIDYAGGFKEPSRPIRVLSAAEGIVSADKAALAIDTADIKEATTLILPATGARGSLIAWTSSDAAVINADTGAAVLPESGIATITLTATLTYGEAEASKAFTVNVYSQAAAEEEKANNKLHLDNAIAALGSFYKLYPAYGTDTNVLAMLQADLAAKGYADVTASIEAVEEVYGGAGIDGDGTVIYYYVDPNTTPTVRMGSYTVRFALAYAGESEPLSVPVILYWDADKVRAAMEEEIASKVTGDSLLAEGDTLNAVTGNLTLPHIVDDKHWTQISWLSSDPQVLSVSDEKQTTADTLFAPYVGVIRQGAEDKQITLTGLFTFMLTNDINGSETPITLSKVFTVTVKALTPAQLEALRTELEDKLNTGFARVGLTDAVTGERLTETGGKYIAYNDILFPTTRDFGVDGKEEPVYLETSDPAYIRTPDVNNAARAEVYRPAVGSADAEATVTVSITDKNTNITVSKAFTVVLPALTQDEIDREKALMETVKAAYFDGIRGANTDPENIRKNLSPFVEVYEQDGVLVWVRDAKNAVNHGIVPVALDGWADLEAWRLFKSSNPTAVAHETLEVTLQKKAKTVTVSSALSSETLGKYGKLYQEDPVAYAAYATLADLYYQPVAAELVICGTTTRLNTKPVPVTETIDVSFCLKSSDGVLIAPITYKELPETTSVFDVFARALQENGFTYQNRGSYIYAITAPDGTTYQEFDAGDFSGWMYKVNDVIPNVNMGACGLKDGDEINVFYTTDFMKEFEDAFDDTPKTSHKSSSSDSKAEATGPNAEPDPQGGSDGTPKPTYTDTVAHWANDAIQAVSEKGLMQGVGNNLFAPALTLSRAMFVTVLYRIEQEPATGETAFADVEGGSWYEKAVAWASANGIVNGVSATQFSPDSDITREQMVTMLFRYAQYKGMATDAAGDQLKRFTDTSKIADYAVAAMNWAVGAGLLKGTSTSTISAQDNTTRAQAATIFMRILQLL